MLDLNRQFKTKYINEPRGIKIAKSFYNDGSIALILKSIEGEQLCIATINLAQYGEKPEPGNVFIKNYSENEWVWEALHKAGIVGDAVRIIEVGQFMSDVVECPLLRKELK
jgi:hypothetical protein